MKQIFDHYNERGEPVDIHGNVITDMAGDGQSIRVPLTLMDEAQRSIAQEHQMQDAKTIQLRMTPQEVEAAINKHLPGYQLVRSGGAEAEAAASRDSYQAGLADAADAAQDDYEAKTSNGWRDTAAPQPDMSGDAQAEFEHRLNNAWR